MNRGVLQQTIIDELALTQLQEPGHAFSLPDFVWLQGMLGVEVERVVRALERDGTVRVQYAGAGMIPVAVRLTQDGLAHWIDSRSATLLPGSQEQLQVLKAYVQRSGPVSTQDIEHSLSVPPLRAHQLVVLLRSLGLVSAAVDAAGQFTAIRWRA